MKRILLTYIMCLISAAFAFGTDIVKTSNGKVKGVPGECEDVIVFKGIPYAEAPIGNLRWAAPQKSKKWKGVRECSEFGNIAYQDTQTSGIYFKEFYNEKIPQMSEDCLFLNVWAPKETLGNKKAKLPVALWIHGGAYAGGYGNEITMDGTEWAKRGVILVTINYRLGQLGFMCHPDLSKEQGGHSGNYGMLDQIAALEWVSDNISAFGGDPSNITVLGQSAGALSVKNLVSSPLAKPMIAKAIIQSGGGLAEVQTPAITAKKAEEYCKSLLESAGYSSISEARKVPAQELRESLKPYVGALLGKLVQEGISFFDAMLLLSPHVDGVCLPKTFDEAVADGSVADIPYMIGSVTADGDFLGGKSVTRFASKFDSKPCYVYSFTRQLPGDDAGAFHSAELWYMFGTLKRCWRPFGSEDYALSERMLEAWTSFCKTGDPGWEPYSKEDGHIEIFDVK